MRALLYARVSHDRTGQQRSVDEQLHDLRRWVHARGWTIVREVIDNDVSASRHGKKKRPGWQKVVATLEAGEVDALAVWEDSRTTRQLGEWAQLRDLMRTRGVVLLAGDQLTDFADPGQALSAGVKAVVSEHEADQARARIQRAMRANAAKGRPHGRRLYGYQRVYDPTTGVLVGQEPDPVEAEVVRRIFDRFLAGAGARTIASELVTDQVTTSTGAEWKDSQVRRVLTNPAYAARRVHQGEVVGEGTWPPLVDVGTFDRVQAKLEQRRSAGIRTVSSPRMLSGIARCGKCGEPMYVGHDRVKRKVYQCRSGFHVARDQLKLDEFVSAVLIERLGRPDVAAALAARDDAPAQTSAAAARLQELRTQLDSAVEQFAAGALSASTLAKIEQRLLPDIAEAESEARRVFVGLDLDVPVDVEGWWADLDAQVRREVPHSLLASVTVLPTRRGSGTFDPDAVVIDWRR